MSREKKPNEFSRLPTSVVPSHYFLTIRPELGDFTFSGSETINVQVCERTSRIVLNSLDIAIQAAAFVSNSQGKLALLRRFQIRFTKPEQVYDL